jgi:hypothetical protein
VYRIAHQIPPFHFVVMRGRHVHHLVFGIVILLAVGYVWLAEIGVGASPIFKTAGEGLRHKIRSPSIRKCREANSNRCALKKDVSRTTRLRINQWLRF